MNPSNSSKRPNCGNPTTTECVTWQGDDISCLGIERGQLISISIANVANEVCSIKDTLDLSDVDLKCVFDLCISCPQPEKTLKVVLQLIINKICSINDIISELNTSSVNSEDPLIRLASCFQFTNSNGDLVIELPHTEYTRRIANQVCQILLTVSSLQDDIQDLNDRVDDLQQQVETIQNQSTEVSSDCLFTGNRPIDEAYGLLDQAFCQLRTVLGSTTDMNQAIGQQCTNLNPVYSSNPSWKLNPSTLSDTINNLWVVMCNVLSRVSTIETTCCAITCDDVKIGFITVLNSERTEVTIRFTAGAGTNLPAGFNDIGSILTISDQSGNSIDFNVSVQNNGEEFIDLTGLNPSDNYNFSLAAKISNGSLTCDKCITRTAIASGAACDFCKITNVGTSGQIVIVYEE